MDKKTYLHQYYQKHRREIIHRASVYYVLNRNKVLRRVRSYSLKNAEKISVYKRKWYFRNKLKVLNRLRQWTKDNGSKIRAYRKRRYRLASSTGNFRTRKTEWKHLLAFYQHTCLRCGATSKQQKLVADHVIPIRHGGLNTIENIQPLCAPCNQWKGKRHFDFRSASVRQR